MKRIAQAPNEERQMVFIDVAHQRGLTPEVVEKDFWVSWILGEIFQDATLSPLLCFKGGTSLSKVYGIIERFSEDIDLILAKHSVLNEGEELIQKSNRKQKDFNKVLDLRAGAYISTKLLMAIESCLAPICSVRGDSDDPHVIWVRYPRMFDGSYILADVKLEIGPVALWNPNDQFLVDSFVNQVLPELALIQPRVPTVMAERTFWEKITILHHEHHRPVESTVPARYSRHYYDVYKLAHTKIKGEALGQLNLLAEVVAFKKRFYPRGWANYDAATLGTIRLLPAKHNMNALRSDYAEMQNMIYGEYPSWDELLTYLSRLEKELNSAL